MHFNRFDICEAYYMYGLLFHTGIGSFGYEILSRLTNIGFSPGFTLKEPDNLSNNAREIFDNLVQKHSEDKL